MAHEGAIPKFGRMTDADEPDNIVSNSINDEHFIRDLNRLKELRSFLIQEAIFLGPDESSTLQFGRLNLLRHREDGRSPTQNEWSEVERLTQALFGRLSEPLRRRFLLGEIPSWMSLLPILFAVVALVALVVAVVVRHQSFLGRVLGDNVLPYYLIWLMSLGAIGAVAFIGMNALSVQQDITFDLTNQRLMLLRITLGALFGLVLTLPFGFTGFKDFTAVLSGNNPTGSDPQKITTQALLLLFPFILGFSTSLVIMVLNRLVDAVQAFFGKASGDSGASRSSASRNNE
jgi:hypothetical protein